MSPSYTKTTSRLTASTTCFYFLLAVSPLKHCPWRGFVPSQPPPFLPAPCLSFSSSHYHLLWLPPWHWALWWEVRGKEGDVPAALKLGQWPKASSHRDAEPEVASRGRVPPSHQLTLLPPLRQPPLPGSPGTQESHPLTAGLTELKPGHFTQQSRVPPLFTPLPVGKGVAFHTGLTCLPEMVFPCFPGGGGVAALTTWRFA